MLTPRENAMAIYNGQQPDYYGDFMPTMDLVIDPIMMCEMIPQDGQLHQDGWGVTKKWPVTDAGMCPMITDENIDEMAAILEECMKEEASAAR